MWAPAVKKTNVMHFCLVLYIELDADAHTHAHALNYLGGRINITWIVRGGSAHSREIEKVESFRTHFLHIAN